MKPTGTEARICELIAQRQQMGIAKYGTTVEDNPLGLVQWLKHLRDEMLDGAVYAQRAIEQLEGLEEHKKECAKDLAEYAEWKKARDPHAELRKTWKPGQKWQSLGEEGWVNLFFEPKWLPGTQYRRHPDDKDQAPEAEKPWYPDDSKGWVEVTNGVAPTDLHPCQRVYILGKSDRLMKRWHYTEPGFPSGFNWNLIVAYKVAK